MSTESKEEEKMKDNAKDEKDEDDAKEERDENKDDEDEEDAKEEKGGSKGSRRSPDVGSPKWQLRLRKAERATGRRARQVASNQTFLHPVWSPHQTESRSK